MRASFLLAAAFSVGSLAAHDHSHHLHARRGDVCATDCTVKRVLKAIKFLPDAAEICRSLLRLPGTVTQTAVETPTVYDVPPDHEAKQDSDTGRQLTIFLVQDRQRRCLDLYSFRSKLRPDGEGARRRVGLITAGGLIAS